MVFRGRGDRRRALPRDRGGAEREDPEWRLLRRSRRPVGAPPRRPDCKAPRSVRRRIHLHRQPGDRLLPPDDARRAAGQGGRDRCRLSREGEVGDAGARVRGFDRGGGGRRREAGRAHAARCAEPSGGLRGRRLLAPRGRAARDRLRVGAGRKGRRPRAVLRVLILPHPPVRPVGGRQFRPGGRFPEAADALRPGPLRDPGGLLHVA